MTGAASRRVAAAVGLSLVLLAGCTRQAPDGASPGPSPAPSGQASDPVQPTGTAPPVLAPSPPASALPERPVLRRLEVSPSGDDGASGRPGDPFGTLKYALEQLRPGDELVVRGGDYREKVDLQVTPGTEQAPIRVVAAPGERPVLKGLLWLRQPTWWQIRGLNVTWDTKNHKDDHMVKITDGTDWTLADAELWGARSFAALLVSGHPERFTLTGLYVHDTKKTNDDNQDHLVYLNCGTGGGVLERSLLVGSPNGRAVKIGPPDKYGDPVGNVVVRFNTMVDNRGPSNVQLSYDTSGVVLERNIMVGSGDGQPSVTAFELSGGSNTVTDNVTWDSTASVELGVSRLDDAGGNRKLDPQLSGPDGPRPYEPQNPQAQQYGRWAP